MAGCHSRTRTFWADVSVALPPHRQVVCVVCGHAKDAWDGDLLDAARGWLDHLGLQQTHRKGEGRAREAT